jgi:hypothetical protein
MSGDPATIVEKAESTLKVLDLLTITLTRWTSLISLTKTPLEELRRSAAPVSSAEPNKASAEPRNTMLKARSPPPALVAMRPPPIRFPFAAIYGCPRNVRLPAAYQLAFAHHLVWLTTCLRVATEHISWSPAGRNAAPRSSSACTLFARSDLQLAVATTEKIPRCCQRAPLRLLRVTGRLSALATIVTSDRRPDQPPHEKLY